LREHLRKRDGLQLDLALLAAGAEAISQRAIVEDIFIDDERVFLAKVEVAGRLLPASLKPRNPTAGRLAMSEERALAVLAGKIGMVRITSECATMFSTKMRVGLFSGSAEAYWKSVIGVAIETLTAIVLVS
jgi:hypothetical protein